MQKTENDWPADGHAGWIGKTHEASDVLTASLADRFMATVPLAGTGLGASSPPDDAASDSPSPLPLCLHWCLAPIAEPAGRLGPDGHPEMGLYLPPIANARRMWAGGRLTFHDGLQAGDLIHRQTIIQGIERKQGRSGSLVFAELIHEYSTPRGLAVTERQDLVYRLDAGGAPPPTKDEKATAEPANPAATVATDPVLLFRYSALTFNGHRIHYDQPYATGVEGYPGLVVHGPLVATLLANLAETQLGGISAFVFRARAPLYCGETLCLYLDETDTGCNLQARCKEDGRLIMTASAGTA